MNIAFRADSSLEIGAGHVMRCLALAQELRDCGHNVSFVCKQHLGHRGEFIRSQGFECYLLPEALDDAAISGEPVNHADNHVAWLGGSWASDAAATAVCLELCAADIVVIDHYSLGESWERAVADTGRKIVVIDDLADRPHECDLLLDQNLGRAISDYKTLVPAHCQILVGPSYALLRSEFKALRGYSLARRKGARVTQIFVSMGGIDKDNITGLVLEALGHCKLPEGCEVVVVLSVLSPGLAEITSMADKMPFPIKIKTDVSNMAELMAQSDIAIGAAGTTAWERCCLGVPSIAIVIADNQRAGGVSMESTGVARVIDSPADIASELSLIMDELVASPTEQAALSERASAVTDGLGAERVCAAMRAHEARY